MRLNMRYLSHKILLLLGLLLLSSIPPAEAVTLEDLQRDNRLKINTWIEPASPIIARQQVVLHIEVSTDRWFSGGTRIGHVEVHDAIVLQRETFAVNSTRREGDQTWVVQQWMLSIYPQRGGDFDIPAIPIHLSIAGKDVNTSITGSLHTAPLSFSAIIPDALHQTGGHWVATTRFEVTEQYNRSLDGLNPGDALIRTIHASADSLPAMMLPDILPESIPGVSVYQKPPRLNDHINRGNYITERTDIFTYVFEKPGSFTLPAKFFYWWNLEAGDIESIEIPAHTLTITGTSHAAMKSNETGKMLPLTSSLQKLLIAGILLFLLISTLSIIRHVLRLKKTRYPNAAISQQALLKLFVKACRKNDVKAAIRLFYQWFDHQGIPSASVRSYMKQLNQNELITGFDQMMYAQYARRKDDSAISLQQFADLWLQTQKKPVSQTLASRWSIQLKLN